ncbi:hypothetical protein LPJ70_004671, partial [Coemansia sp. RSA 2708]
RGHGRHGGTLRDAQAVDILRDRPARGRIQGGRQSNHHHCSHCRRHRRLGAAVQPDIRRCPPQKARARACQRCGSRREQRGRNGRADAAPAKVHYQYAGAADRPVCPADAVSVGVSARSEIQRQAAASSRGLGWVQRQRTATASSL